MRFLALLLFALPVHAADYCQDADLVLDLRTSWDFSNGFFEDYALPTHRQGALHPTKSVLHLGAGADSGELEGFFEFPRQPNEVGLAYNLYRLEIQIGEDDEPDRQIVDQDYTGGCTGPGASLWPGDRLELKAIPLTAHADGAPRGLEAVHLRFWGK